MFNLFQKKEERSTPGPTDDFWYQPISFGGLGNTQINPESAQRLSAVYAAVDIISKSVATLPIVVFRRRGETRERLSQHWLKDLLNVNPHPLINAVVLRRLAEKHLLLRGNAYLVVTRDRFERVTQLSPLHPDRVQIVPMEDLTIQYIYRPPNAPSIAYTNQEILHLKEETDDGIVGRSRIQVAAEVIGAALAKQTHSAATFENHATPAGIMSLPGVLKDKEARDRLREEWRQTYGGRNQGNIAVLEQGVQFEPITITPQDAEFVEQMRFSVEEIARLFDIPPYRLQDFTRATFGNVEESSLNFVKNTIQPRVIAWECALEKDLIRPSGLRNHFVKFNLDSLTRGDLKSRMESYSIAVQNGFLNRDEVRALEDRNPIPDGSGEIFLVPLNMTDANDLGDDEEIEEQESDRTAVLLAERMAELQSECEKLRRTESTAINRALKKPNWAKRCADFYEKHAAQMVKRLKPALEALDELAPEKYPLSETMTSIERYAAEQLDRVMQNASAELSDDLLPLLRDQLLQTKCNPVIK